MGEDGEVSIDDYAKGKCDHETAASGNNDDHHDGREYLLSVKSKKKIDVVK